MKTLKLWRAGYLAFAVLLLLLTGVRPAGAQQLEPRSYWPAPVGLSVAGAAYFYQSGSDVLDASVPLDNVETRMQTVVPFFGHSFDLLGRLAVVTVVVPLVNANVQGDVLVPPPGYHKAVDRTGLGDPAFRFAVNLIGLPALTREEYVKREPETTVGASLTVIAPAGQYDPNKLINISTNRWSVKPEIGISQPFGKWAFEAMAGLWMFTDNSDFYGHVTRRQEPLASYQGHIIYHFTPRMWSALDYAYFTGGATVVNGVHKADRQDNNRVGITFALPVTANQSFKVSWAKGMMVRIGSDYETVGVAWQWNWF
jgi:hypothetical protein